MQKSLVSILVLFIALSIYGQDKLRLSLEDAILKGKSELAPENISGIKWLSPDKFACYGENGALHIKNSKGDDVKTIKTNDLNATLSAINVDSVKSVRPIAWKNSNSFYFKVDRQFFEYDYTTGDLSQVVRIPKKAKNIELAPKTGFVAYTLDNNVYVATSTEDEIAVTNFTKVSGISAGIAIHRSEFGITKGLFWSKDGSKLGFYQMDESMVTDYPLADYSIMPALAEPIKYPMAGQKSHHARVGVFNVENQSSVYLKTGEPKEQYLTNFTFSPDGSTAYLAVLNRGQNHMKLKSFSVETGAETAILFEEKNEKYVEPEEPPHFLPDGSLLWFSKRDGFNHIYHYSKGGKLINQVTKGNFDVKKIVSTIDKGTAIIVEAADGLMNEAVYHVDIRSGKMKRLDKRKGTYSVYGSENSNIIIKYQSYETPLDIDIYSSGGKKLADLKDSENPLSDYRIGKIEFPVIYASDSTKLQGRLIKPFDFDSSKTYPVIVYLYGGPHVQLIKNNYKGGAPLWMYYAANQGYLVFTIDSRGSGNRGLAFEQATFRQLGTVELEDQLKGVEYLKTLPFANTDKMAIHGWSFGGFMTLSMMLRNPDVFEVGVAGGPVTDWNMYEIMYTERYMDTPDENPDGYRNADLKNYVQNLEDDVLIIHGLDDNVVVPQHSYTLLEKFVQNGKQVDFFVYPGYKHNVRGKDRVHLMEKVLNYIELHLN